ncbi:hypothetical protein ABPG74_004767 [Tetrahymena malaccensis]
MADYQENQKSFKAPLTQVDKFKKKNEINTGLSGIKMENSSKDCLQVSNQLELTLIEQKKENKRLIDEIENRKERFQKREQEYRKIIDDLKNEIKNKAVPENAESKKLEEAKDYHKMIMDNIDNIQLKTSKIILDQEKDILRFFNNKITEIKKQFEEERIKKGKKDQDYVEKELKLTSKLEWIKNIAQKIDNENHNLMKKYMDLKAQYQTQENDREMLLKELIMKKKKNAILKSQLEQYEQLFKEATKDIDDEENDDMRMTSSSKKFKSLLNNKSNANHLQSRQNMDKTGQSFNMSNLYKQGTGYYSKEEQIYRSEKTLKTLQNTMRKEQRRARELKLMYLKEIESKSELEVIIKKNVDKIKQEYQSKNPSSKQLLSTLQSKNKNEQKESFTKEMREILIEQLLNDDKVLTLVYDKTFYPDLKNIQIDENNDEYQETEQV